IEPSEVTLIITAAQPLVERLTRDDVRVTADVSAMRAAGTYNVTPTATLREPAEDVNITILPAQMVVVVESSSATPRATSTSDSDDLASVKPDPLRLRIASRV